MCLQQSTVLLDIHRNISDHSDVYFLHLFFIFGKEFMRQWTGLSYWCEYSAKKYFTEKVLPERAMLLAYIFI